MAKWVLTPRRKHNLVVARFRLAQYVKEGKVAWHRKHRGY